ncbi:MAG: DUF4956 domain-containing protein [Oscillospiraceae bacterium]|nr:DUF4956 domain-containing protein [Oscillospiraceae bacterium]
MNSLSGIFRGRFLDAFDPANPENILSMPSILFAFGASLIFGLLIFFVYKYTFGGVMYSWTFNASLLGMTVLTTLIILAIATNLILSLGMMGALSIVRFRTALKDPMDLVFVFWTIGSGLVVGAQSYALALVGNILVAAIIIITSRRLSLDSPYLIVINCENQSIEGECLKIIESSTKRTRLKSKVVSAGKGTEFIYEIRTKDENSGFIDELSKLEGVSNASLISYNGEFLD